MEPVTLHTADGERLRAVHLPGPDHRLAVVLAHGFSGSVDKPAVLRIARSLAATAGVLAYDSRGHGRSTGLSTLGDREVLDVDAAVAAARSLGYSAVITCGWSMGGATVLRHAALRGTTVAGHVLDHAPDAVVAVSTTSRWFVKDTRPMRLLHLAVETRLGRAFTRRRLGTRVSPHGWDPLPVSPVECIADVSPLPLLLVHGDADGFFSLEHPRALHAAAAEPVELWLEPGFGHAEEAAGPELLDRLARRLEELRPVLTVRYWAAAKAAAGVAEEPVDAATLEAALERVRAVHDDRFTDVLARCSFLVDGNPVGSRDHAAVALSEGSLVDCLPPFAGG